MTHVSGCMIQVYPNILVVFFLGILDQLLEYLSLIVSYSFLNLTAASQRPSKVEMSCLSEGSIDYLYIIEKRRILELHFLIILSQSFGWYVSPVVFR